MIVPGRSHRRTPLAKGGLRGLDLFIESLGNKLDKTARCPRLRFCAAARDSPSFVFNTGLFADLPLTLKFTFPQNRCCRPYAAAQNKISKQ